MTSTGKKWGLPNTCLAVKFHSQSLPCYCTIRCINLPIAFGLWTPSQILLRIHPHHPTARQVLLNATQTHDNLGDKLQAGHIRLDQSFSLRKRINSWGSLPHLVASISLSINWPTVFHANQTTQWIMKGWGPIGVHATSLGWVQSQAVNHNLNLPWPITYAKQGSRNSKACSFYPLQQELAPCPCWCLAKVGT